MGGASRVDGRCLTSCQSSGAYVICKVVPIGPLPYPLCFPIPLMSVIDNVLKYGPNCLKTKDKIPKSSTLISFLQPHAAQANINYAKAASMNQHPPAHQLGILSTGWGGISHLMLECALTFPLDFFFGWFFFPPALRSLAQLHTTYLLHPHLLFPPKLVTSFLPTYPPPYLPT